MINISRFLTTLGSECRDSWGAGDSESRLRGDVGSLMSEIEQFRSQNSQKVIKKNTKVTKSVTMNTYNEEQVDTREKKYQQLQSSVFGGGYLEG